MKNTIKIAVAGLVMLGIVSCNDNKDDYDQVTDIQKIAIDSVKLVNDTMRVGASQSIITYSKFSQGCEGFYAYDYQHDNMNRLVSAYKFKTDGVCETPIAQGNKFDFLPQTEGTYIFKFWQGKDVSNNDIILEKTIIVVE